MPATQRLVDLFINVPDFDVGKAGEGRIKAPGNYSVEPVTYFIRNPSEWLERYLIPIVHQPIAAMNGASALFRQIIRGGSEHVEASVWIPTGANIDSPNVRWTVWHEIGHAMDQVQTREDGRMFATPDGSFSIKHRGLLLRHQAEIIRWTPHPNREYKTHHTELWAEVVACAVCNPGLMDGWMGLWNAIIPDLQACNIPALPAWVDRGGEPNPVLNALHGAGWTPECIRESPDPQVRLETDIEHGAHFEGKQAAGLKALIALKDFVGPAQWRAVRDGMRGEEKDFFFGKMIELAGIVEKMPITGETDGQGREAIAWLHYFAGGRANWYIKEKDKGDPQDRKNGVPPQSQAFGLADLFGDGGEMGYISIAEILENGGELDFHFTPKPIRQISP